MTVPLPTLWPLRWTISVRIKSSKMCLCSGVPMLCYIGMLHNHLENTQGVYTVKCGRETGSWEQRVEKITLVVWGCHAQNLPSGCLGFITPHKTNLFIHTLRVLTFKVQTLVSILNCTQCHIRLATSRNELWNMNKAGYVRHVSLLAQQSCVIKHCSRVFIQRAGNMTHATGIYRMYCADQFVCVQAAFAVLRLDRSFVSSQPLHCFLSPPPVDHVDRVPLGS